MTVLQNTKSTCHSTTLFTLKFQTRRTLASIPSITKKYKNISFLLIQRSKSKISLISSTSKLFHFKSISFLKTMKNCTLKPGRTFKIYIMVYFQILRNHLIWNWALWVLLQVVYGHLQVISTLLMWTWIAKVK